MSAARRLALGVLLGVLVSAGTLLTAACPPPLPPGVVYVKVGPPVPVPEVRVVAPGPDFVWIPGYHRWDGGAYVWVAGHWERGPRPHAVWVAGHWKQTRNGWYWVDGHWN